MSNEEPIITSDSDSEADTEGHMPFKRTVTPAGEEGSEEGDDAEGHAFRRG